MGNLVYTYLHPSVFVFPTRQNIDLKHEARLEIQHICIICNLKSRGTSPLSCFQETGNRPHTNVGCCTWEAWVQHPLKHQPTVHQIHFTFSINTHHYKNTVLDSRHFLHMAMTSVSSKQLSFNIFVTCFKGSTESRQTGAPLSLAC